MSRIWYPGLLALVLGFAGLTGILLAMNGEESPVSQAPAGQDLQEVTAEEASAAEAALRESGLIARLNGGQPWKVDLYTTSRSGTQKLGVLMSVVWARPVSTDGPWSSLLCRGTVSVERNVTWEELTSVTVIVGLETHEVLSLTAGGLEGPGAPEQSDDSAHPAPGQTLEPLPRCPRDMEDDD